MTEIVLTATALATALRKLASRPSPSSDSAVDQYTWLQSNVHQTDTASDADFQRRFNRYYRVRRNADWRGYFYTLLEREKLGTPSLGDVLRAIHDQTQRIEGSFASKLVATIRPSEPVLDSVILNNLKLTMPRPGSVDARIDGIVRVHTEIREAFAAFLMARGGRDLVSQFRRVFPTADVTEMKMVDLVLWQSRES